MDGMDNCYYLHIGDWVLVSVCTLHDTSLDSLDSLVTFFRSKTIIIIINDHNCNSFDQNEPRLIHDCVALHLFLLL